MNEYSTANVKLTDTQLKKLKTTVKSKTGMTLRMSLKMIDRNDQRHELFVTTRQKTNLRNAFNNSLSTDLKLTTAQISEIIQSGVSLLTKLGGSSMKVAVPLAKNILVQLGITATTSATDTEIQNKLHGSGTTTLIISNKEINDIMKIVQALNDCNILLKGVTNTVEKEAKEKKGGFLSILLGTLGASLLENLLTGKGIVRADSGNKDRKGIARAGYGKEWNF